MRFWLFIWCCALLLHAEEIVLFEANVTVKQSGALHVQEAITYDFGAASRHGIYRDIPVQAAYRGVVRDIGIDTFRVGIDDEPYVPFEVITRRHAKAGKFVRIKIGDKHRLINGTHRYRIGYNVAMGVLPASDDENDDAIRWNVNGTGWSVPIKALRASFRLPPSLHKDNVRIRTFVGTYGTISTRAEVRWLDAHTLAIDLADLAPYENVTVEIAFDAMTLDQNGQLNFVKSIKERLYDDWYWLALLGYLIFFYRRYEAGVGRKDERAVAVQYDPPKGMSLLQAGLILDRFADNKDFGAAILELATKGYYTIEETPTKTPYLHRTSKPLETSLSYDQRYLLNEVLFEGGKRVFAFRKHDASLAHFLQMHLEHLNEHLYAWAVRSRYMQENPKRARNRFAVHSIVLLLPLYAYALYRLFETYGHEAISNLILGGIYLAAAFPLLKRGKRKLWYLLALVGVGATMLWQAFSAGGIPQSVPFYLAIALSLVAIFIYHRTGPYTLKGARAQKHLLGLKAFIKRVKTDEIKRRLQEDPRFLDKLLPYTALFGETDHWLEHYAHLSLQTPDWYEGEFYWMYGFNEAIYDALTPPPSTATEATGFGGGGGFSGGGIGGGGGGSW